MKIFVLTHKNVKTKICINEFKVGSFCMKEAIKSKQVLLKNNSYLKVMLLLFNITFNILVLFTAVLIKDMSFEQWLFSFALLSLVQLLVNIITVSKLEKAFFFNNLISNFSYITHLGMVVIFGFDINVELPWDPLLSITKDTFREASYFAIFVMHFNIWNVYGIIQKENI